MRYPFLLILAIGAIALAALIGRGWRRTIVHAWQAGAMYRDGHFVRMLPPGRHGMFDPFGRIRIGLIDIVERRARIGPIDILSADRFAFRLHMGITYRIADPRAAYEAMQGAAATSHPEDVPGLSDAVTAATIVVAGARSLDEIIGDAAGVADAVRAHLSIPHTEIIAVALLRIELPPEVRRMLTEVERARRDGQAQLERARGEQAALRSLANAARLVRDNPELAQLRLLQTIETTKGPTTIVIGDPRATTAQPTPPGQGGSAG